MVLRFETRSFCTTCSTCWHICAKRTRLEPQKPQIIQNPQVTKYAVQMTQAQRHMKYVKGLGAVAPHPECEHLSLSVNTVTDLMVTLWNTLVQQWLALEWRTPGP